MSSQTCACVTSLKVTPLWYPTGDNNAHAQSKDTQIQLQIPSWTNRAGAHWQHCLPFTPVRGQIQPAVVMQRHWCCVLRPRYLSSSSHAVETPQDPVEPLITALVTWVSPGYAFSVNQPPTLASSVNREDRLGSTPQPELAEDFHRTPFIHQNTVS